MLKRLFFSREWRFYIQKEKKSKQPLNIEFTGVSTYVVKIWDNLNENLIMNDNENYIFFTILDIVTYF